MSDRDTGGETDMKEEVLDGFFRCPRCGRRYHLEDALESEACCDKCGATLEPEMEDTEGGDEDQLGF
jgi:transcription initiation factor IIE alpha subunit